MDTHRLTVVQCALDPARAAAFWSGLLALPGGGRGATEVPGDERRPTLRFVPGSPAGREHDGFHLHVLTADEDDLRATVDLVLRTGGRHLDVGRRPDERHVVLADPEGYPFCVLPPGGTFLAGSGRLAEVTCDGHRATGLFWSAALDRPLVWDRDGETAVETAPEGGTKISWGGPPVAAPPATAAKWLELVVDDPAAERERLLAAGAGALPDVADGTVRLTDPDGFVLRVSRAP
ncbi:VOC family protein [Phycicoccus flavus]|uniref:VOC family protein n=1 Tax=Phycicoccus flavus TaxID=2502783 RepID=A0A8T6R6V6_9MICO|nr:VOC family protein [Phycicoccus flavus]NHA69190.1 VOC family protein [Phycicoccus flavus]